MHDIEVYDKCFALAEKLSDSEMLPQAYKGKPASVAIAIIEANRLGLSPLFVMQNLDVIRGKPAWRSQAIIALINSSPKFTEGLEWEFDGEGDQKTCVAVAKKINGDMVKGPPISIAMAKAEGWYDRNGSKWQTLPRLMLMYRAAAFFGRLYCPEMMAGLQSEDEAIDSDPPKQTMKPPPTMKLTTSGGVFLDNLNPNLPKMPIDLREQEKKRLAAAKSAQEESVEEATRHQAELVAGLHAMTVGKLSEEAKEELKRPREIERVDDERIDVQEHKKNRRLAASVEHQKKLGEEAKRKDAEPAAEAGRVDKPNRRSVPTAEANYRRAEITEHLNQLIPELTDENIESLKAICELEMPGFKVDLTQMHTYATDPLELMEQHAIALLADQQKGEANG